MKGGIIAAGYGTRLASLRGATPKPLLPFMGKPLLFRILDEFVDAEISEVVLITNPETWPSISVELNKHGLEEYVRPVIKRTESGMKSFFEIGKVLSREPFLLSVCDVAFSEGTICQFLKWASPRQFDLAIAVTSAARSVPKPVSVLITRQGEVLDLGRDIPDSGIYTAGFYVITPRVLELESNALETRSKSLWQFLKLAVSETRNTIARDVGPVFDINTKEDYDRAIGALVAR